MESIANAVSHTVERIKDLVIGHPAEEQQKEINISSPTGFQENKVVTEQVEEVREELPAVLHETKKFVEREEIQPVIHRNREATEIHLSEKEINESSVRATKVVETSRPAQYVEFKSKGAQEVETVLEQERAKYQSTVEVLPSSRQVVTKPPIVEEFVHKKIIKEVQPVINRETIAPVVYKETVPIYEKIIEAPKVIHEKEHTINRGLVSSTETPAHLKSNEFVGYGKNYEAESYGSTQYSSGLSSGSQYSSGLGSQGFSSGLSSGSQYSSGLGSQGLSSTSGSQYSSGLNSGLSTGIGSQGLSSTSGLSSGLGSGSQYSSGLGSQGLSSGLSSGNQYSTGLGSQGLSSTSGLGSGSQYSSGQGLGSGLSSGSQFSSGLGSQTSGLSTGLGSGLQSSGQYGSMGSSQYGGSGLGSQSSSLHSQALPGYPQPSGLNTGGISKGPSASSLSEQKRKEGQQGF